jgi:hypothetical protein
MIIHFLYCKCNAWCQVANARDHKSATASCGGEKQALFLSALIGKFLTFKNKFNFEIDHPTDEIVEVLVRITTPLLLKPADQYLADFNLTFLHRHQ